MDFDIAKTFKNGAITGFIIWFFTAVNFVFGVVPNVGIGGVTFSGAKALLMQFLTYPLVFGFLFYGFRSTIDPLFSIAKFFRGKKREKNTNSL